MPYPVRGAGFGAAMAFAVALVLPTLSSAGVTVTYAYDQQGQLVSVSKSTGEVVGYSYDAAGNRTQVAPPVTNHTPVCATSKTINMSTVPIYAGPITQSVNPIAYAPACTDADADTLTVTSVYGFTNQGAGTVSGNNVTVTNIRSGGGTTFTYAVSDGKGGGTTGSFTISRP